MHHNTLFARPHGIRIPGLALSRFCALAVLGTAGWILGGGVGEDFQLTQTVIAQDGDEGRGGRGDEGRGGRGGEGRGGRGGEGRGGEGRGGRGGEGRGGRGGEGGRGGWGGGGGGGWGGGGGMGRAPGMRDIMEQLQADFMRRDVGLFVDQLALDDAQTLVLETLFDDYEGDYEIRSSEVQDQLRSLGQRMFQTMMSPEMRDGMRESMQEIRAELDDIAAEQGAELSSEERREFYRERMQQMQQEMMDSRAELGLDLETQAAIKEIFDLFEQWTIEKSAMRERFVEGLKSQLDDDQLAAWPAFHRFLVREKSLPKSRLSGEGTNLFLAIDEFGLDDASFDRLEPLFDEYELALHQSLMSRDSYLETSAPKLYKALQSGDKDEARRLVDRQVDYRKAVRNVNDQFIDTFSSEVRELDEATGLAFARSMKERAYDRIYRTTRGERAFDGAMEMDLDEEIMTAVVELYSGYMRELDSMNERIVTLVRKEEPETQVEQVDRMASMIEGNFMSMWGGSGGEEESDLDEAYDRRRDLEESYMDRLESLLTPEQLEALPGRSRRGGGGGGGGGGGWGSGGFDMEQMPEEVRERILERYDTDGDGELSESEMEEIRNRFRGGGGRGGRGGEGGRGGNGAV
ncbi:MAG: hypothetical protein MK082_12950 [Phycisphaerales bacterium]|nr:hypothetical protein [Phycisphaerales bacterium]